MHSVLKSISFLVVLLSASAYAAPIRYFSAEVPVLSQSRAEQKKAAKAGLLEVLVRVSGSELVRKNDVVLSRADKALSFVSQFQYGDVEQASLRDEGYTHLLQLSYSGRLVRNLLEEAQLPVWSVNRPKTLIWLVEDSLEFGKRMLSSEDDSAIFRGVQEAARYRGLPLAYPLLDFDDQLALGAEKLWSLDEQAIIEASQRYKADVILVGKFSTMSSGQVLSSWQLFHANKTRVYDLRSESAEEIGYQAMLPVADYLASLYSYHSFDSEYFSLSVVNVDNFADYRGLISSLTRFDTITEVRIDKVDHDQVDLRLKSEASLDQVIKQISLARKLYTIDPEHTADIPEWEREEAGSPQNPLLYRWQR